MSTPFGHGATPPASSPGFPPFVPQLVAMERGDTGRLLRARQIVRDVLAWRPVVGLNGWVHLGEYDADDVKAIRQQQLLSSADSVADAVDFLRHCRSRRTMNRTRSGRDWVRLALAWHAARGNAVGIPLGAFIVAALDNGNLRVEPIGRGPDVHFNLTLPAWGWR